MAHTCMISYANEFKLLFILRAAASQVIILFPLFNLLVCSVHHHHHYQQRPLPSTVPLRMESIAEKSRTTYLQLGKETGYGVSEGKKKKKMRKI